MSAPLRFGFASGVHPAIAGVPLEVYDDALALVGRALSSDELELPPGRYFVRAQQPTGPELQATVEVEDELGGLARLAPLPAPGAASAGVHWSESETWGATYADSYAITGEVDDGRVFAPRMPARRERVAFCALEEGRWRLVDELDVDEEVAALPPPPGVGAIGVTNRGGRAAWVRFPADGGWHYRVGIAAGPHGLRPAARLANEDANALLAYVDHGLVEHAALLARSPAISAENLLHGKRRDPVAAAAGAFALLRLGDVERLHDWTANLVEWFPWLPDAHVARAEHAARLGRHDEAEQLLRGLPDVGLPSLSAALSYAVERLRVYARLHDGDERLADALSELSRYAVATDFHAPVTTFYGDRPDEPRPFARPQPE